MVEEAQDESSQSDQESDGTSGSSDSATEATETTEEEASPGDTAEPEKTAEPKKSGLNIHLILYPVLLILVAAAAILATILFIGKDQTEASDNSDQLGSESTPYQISAESRPILVENITFQTKSSGNTVMVSLQLVVEKAVHTKWGALSPEIQSILKTEIKNQTMKELSKAIADDLKDYSNRDGYAEGIQKAVNDKVFNPFVKKGPKEDKDAAKYFKPAEKPIVKKVIFYELIVVDN
ncbi:hypothetical protein CMK14_14345 [Candidatus Poribacteria bacterium]|nr:hypothetical protein [Candidatus Poribacteria bacterium]